MKLLVMALVFACSSGFAVATDVKFDELQANLEKLYRENGNNENWSDYVPYGVSHSLFLKEFDAECKVGEGMDWNRLRVAKSYLQRTKLRIWPKLSRAYRFFSQIQSLLSTIEWKEVQEGDTEHQSISKEEADALRAKILNRAKQFIRMGNRNDFLETMDKIGEHYKERNVPKADANFERIDSQIRNIFVAYADEKQEIPPKIEPVAFYVKVSQPEPEIVYRDRETIREVPREVIREVPKEVIREVTKEVPKDDRDMKFFAWLEGTLGTVLSRIKHEEGNVDTPTAKITLNEERLKYLNLKEFSKVYNSFVEMFRKMNKDNPKNTLENFMTRKVSRNTGNSPNNLRDNYKDVVDNLIDEILDAYKSGKNPGQKINLKRIPLVTIQYPKSRTEVKEKIVYRNVVPGDLMKKAVTPPSGKPTPTSFPMNMDERERGRGYEQRKQMDNQIEKK